MDEVVKITFAAARVNAQLTQKELAEKLGVTADTVANWEKGKTEPATSQLRLISELSGIPMDFLFAPTKS